MKPKIDYRKCCAIEDMCGAIKVCPTQAISFIVDESITIKDVVCDCASPTENANSGCGCGCSDNSCDETPYGRIIIDYTKCTECGACVEGCCGAAIDMVD